MNMDWLANPWITIVKGRVPFTIDLSFKLLHKPQCNSASKKEAISLRNCVFDDGNHFGLMPRSKNESYPMDALFQEVKRHT